MKNAKRFRSVLTVVLPMVSQSNTVLMDGLCATCCMEVYKIANFLSVVYSITLTKAL